MKLAKMSLAAALLLGVNAYAIDNVKVNGDVKVYYGTVDSDAAGSADVFDKDASFADTSLHLGLTADLSEGVSAGISMTAVSTLGLENNLVSNTWSSAHTATANAGTNLGVQVDDEMWVDEAWIAGTAMDTTVKLGRQALDTPLAFTETWGVDTNTFEAAVLLNQSISDTTLVAAYVGKGNGTAGGVTGGGGVGAAGYVNAGGKFDSFYNGAYIVGAINNSWKPLSIQAWYYDLQNTATAYWVQADLDIEGVLLGGQYTSVDADGAVNGAEEDTAYAAMLGYAMKDVVTVKAAFSSVDEDGTLGVANTATSTNQSKLYTEMWWNYGTVSATGAETMSLTVEATVGPEVELMAGYHATEVDTSKGSTVLNAKADGDYTESYLTVNKAFGPLDTGLAVIYHETAPDVGTDVKDTTILVMLGYNF